MIFQNSRHTLYCFVLVCLSIALFLPVLGFDFTYDDSIHIVKNDYVSSSDISFFQVLSTFAQPTIPGDLYRPLNSLSFRITHILFGADPFYFHCTNLILYLISIVLAYFFFFYLTKLKHFSFLAALIFLVHPVHTEVVANNFNRNEMLVYIFGLLSIFCFYKYFINNKERVFYLLGLVLYFFACLSKETGVLFLFLIPCYLYYSLEKASIRKLLTPFIGLSLCFLTYLGLRYYVLMGSILIPEYEFHQPENPIFLYDFQDRIIPALFIFAEYIRLLILPLKLSADYSLPHNYYWELLSSSYGVVNIFISIIFIIGSLSFFNKKYFIYIIWFYISFSLTLNFIVPIGTIMAERLTFLPSLGFCGLIATIFTLLYVRIKKIFTTSLFLLYVAFFIIQTTTRLPVWKNDITLFNQTVLDNVYSPKASFIRGVKHYEIGKYNIAIESFKEAVFRDNTMDLAVRHLIYTLVVAKQIPQAMYWIDKYLETIPDSPGIIKLKEDLEKVRKGQVLDNTELNLDYK